jgi:C4-dicarboxylate-specific signal transduction histidine kinase
LIKSKEEYAAPMDKKTMEHIFDPFFATKGLARGIDL